VRLLDLAEYAPIYDLDGRTGRMAALCVCALLAGRASRQRSTHEICAGALHEYSSRR
jgi:hypothetical protein